MGLVCCANSVRNSTIRVAAFYTEFRLARGSAVVVLNSINTGCCNSVHSAVLGTRFSGLGPVVFYVRKGRRVQP